MDIIKQYIIQSIAAASNNLRLNTQKIEIVALLREAIIKSDSIERDIRSMKKITELSKLAIRFGEIHQYLTQPQIDLFKFSDKLKEHSQLLIKDLSYMLDVVNPAAFRDLLEKLKTSHEEPPKEEPSAIDVDLSKRKADEVFIQKKENEKLKEEIILGEERDEEESFFLNFESEIIKPIKNIDNMLKQLSSENIDVEEIAAYAAIMKKHGELSEKKGYEIIANMHLIIARALKLVAENQIETNAQIIESMRACLIVIVAVVRGKEVDITNYLNRAESFGRKILSIK